MSLWPDVAGPFAEVVPDGLALSIAEDEWTGEARRRRLELHASQPAPGLPELLDEAQLDAVREGWTQLEDGRFELEDVLLTLAVEDAFIAELLQPWPPEPPVETSDMFQNLVRKLLGLNGAPTRLMKRVEVEGHMRASAVEEEVEMASPENLLAAFHRLGFSPPGQDGGWWRSEERTEKHRIIALVRKTKNWAHVRMRKEAHPPAAT